MSPIYEIDTYHNNNAWNRLNPTVFALEQAKATIRAELDTMTPFHKGRDEKHAEIDQLDDMISRRRT